jgi:hypothetical protein
VIVQALANTYRRIEKTHKELLYELKMP